jgi:asparagine synthase (glutamine-hydrolysing)
MGHRRLAIIDPSPAGHQPMASERDDLCIVFNGEIYNFKELREEVKPYGYQFRSNTDTEVLLGAYHHFGKGMLQKLNGIFGFAIWDVQKQILFAARDHFGVKPIYYAFDENRFMLASEIKALVQVEGFDRSLDLQSLDDFLTFRYTPSPNTLFAGIKRLAPGHALWFDPIDWRLETFRYYAPSPKIQKGWTLDEWQEAYSEALVQAVRRQLISDVPIGILLSGGVDSGLVTAIAASMVGAKVKTFTVGFTGDHAANEIAEARETSALLGTDHSEVLVHPDEYLGFMQDAIWYMDEPLGTTSLIPMYFVSKLASQSVKVVLTGQGADEPLAGYQRYIGEKFVRPLGLLLGNPISKYFIERLPRQEQLRRAASALPLRDWRSRFINTYALFTADEKRRLLKPDLIKKPGRDLDYMSYWAAGLGLGSLNRMLYIDTRMSLPDDLLNYGDKMSMAASIEARVPFLDVDLVNLIETMPSELKLKGFKIGKYLHKLVARKWLPAKVINRPKKGFQTPIDEWFQSELSGELRSTLLSKESYCNRYFSTDYLAEMIRDHVTGRRDHQRQLFALLTFELWAKRFLGL